MRFSLNGAPAWLALALVGGLFGTGCRAPRTDAPPPAPPVAGKSSLPDLPPDPRALKRGGATSGADSPLPSKPVDGSALNRFFPKDSGADNVTYTQEKRGTSMAQLARDGKPVAQLSITDAAENPSLRDKYKTATATVAGYPSAGASSQETAVLVAGRFQVKVRSKDASFGAGEREAVLERFDLAGLAALK